MRGEAPDWAWGLTRALLELASLLLPTVLATVVWLLTEAAVGVSRSRPRYLDLVLVLSSERTKAANKRTPRNIHRSLILEVLLVAEERERIGSPFEKHRKFQSPGKARARVCLPLTLVQVRVDSQQQQR